MALKTARCPTASASASTTAAGRCSLPLAVSALLGDGCTNVVEVRDMCFHGFGPSEYIPDFTGTLAKETALRLYWTCKERTGVLCYDYVR